jgi:hypothetical protein
MPPNAAHRLTRYVLTQAEHEPLAARIGILRDAAEVLAGEAEAALLAAMLADLEAAEAKHRQLLLALTAA